MTRRPKPPELDLEDCRRVFVANDLEAWLRAEFIDPAGSLYNPDHEHLERAAIRCQWAHGRFLRGGREILGQAAIPRPPREGGAWARDLWYEHQAAWWGSPFPDFVITLSAPWAAHAPDAEFCAVAEHELYHCAIKCDEWGSPKFDSTGNPRWDLRGHDLEEFRGVAARWGVAAPGIAEMVVAARSVDRRVEVDAIRAACGTC